MPRFSATFESTVQVTRFYECEDRAEAEQLAQMDAEDGQIGPFPYDIMNAEVTDVTEAPST